MKTSQEIDKIEIEKAIQQMIGFKLGKWGADIIELISSMGLKKEEWEYLKKFEDNGRLDDDDIKEINEYFKQGEKLTK